MDMRSEAAKKELEELARIEDWKQFHTWLILDWQCFEPYAYQREMVSTLIEIARRNIEGSKIRLEIINDPRRARRRYLLELFRAYEKFKKQPIA